MAAAASLIWRGLADAGTRPCPKRGPGVSRPSPRTGANGAVRALRRPENSRFGGRKPAGHLPRRTASQRSASLNVTPLASGRPDRRAATLVMACLGVFVAYLPVTTVSVSLPAIQAALSASTAQLSWVQDAFVLPMAAFILTARRGRRRPRAQEGVPGGPAALRGRCGRRAGRPVDPVAVGRTGTRRDGRGRAAAHDPGPDQPRRARSPRTRQVHRPVGDIAPDGTGRRTADHAASSWSTRPGGGSTSWSFPSH